MTKTTDEAARLDLSEQVAMVDSFRAETEKTFLDLHKLMAGAVSTNEQGLVVPTLRALSGPFIGAALFAAGAAFAKLFIG